MHVTSPMTCVVGIRTGQTSMTGAGKGEPPQLWVLAQAGITPLEVSDYLFLN